MNKLENFAIKTIFYFAISNKINAIRRGIRIVELLLSLDAGSEGWKYFKISLDAGSELWKYFKISLDRDPKGGILANTQK